MTWVCQGCFEIFGGIAQNILAKSLGEAQSVDFERTIYEYGQSEKL